MKYKKKKITIEDLAVMIKHGFDETAKRADVDARFEKIESRLVGVDSRLNGVDARLDKVATKSDIERLGKEIAALHYDISFVQSMPARLERRMDTLEDGLRLVKTKLGMR